MKVTLSIKRVITTTPVRANLEDVKLELEDVTVEDFVGLKALYSDFAQEQEPSSTLEDLLKSSPFGQQGPFQKPSEFFSGPLFKSVSSLDPKDVMGILKTVGKDIAGNNDKSFDLEKFLHDEMKNLRKKD